MLVSINSNLENESIISFIISGTKLFTKTQLEELASSLNKDLGRDIIHVESEGSTCRFYIPFESEPYRNELEQIFDETKQLLEIAAPCEAVEINFCPLFSIDSADQPRYLYIQIDRDINISACDFSAKDPSEYENARKLLLEYDEDPENADNTSSEADYFDEEEGTFAFAPAYEKADNLRLTLNQEPIHADRIRDICAASAILECVFEKELEDEWNRDRDSNIQYIRAILETADPDDGFRSSLQEQLDYLTDVTIAQDPNAKPSITLCLKDGVSRDELIDGCRCLQEVLEQLNIDEIENIIDPSPVVYDDDITWATVSIENDGVHIHEECCPVGGKYGKYLVRCLYPQTNIDNFANLFYIMDSDMCDPGLDHPLSAMQRFSAVGMIHIMREFFNETIGFDMESLSKVSIMLDRVADAISDDKNGLRSDAPQNIRKMILYSGSFGNKKGVHSFSGFGDAMEDLIRRASAWFGEFIRENHSNIQWTYFYPQDMPNVRIPAVARMNTDHDLIIPQGRINRILHKDSECTLAQFYKWISDPSTEFGLASKENRDIRVIRKNNILNFPGK